MTTEAEVRSHPIGLLDQGMFDTLVARLHKDHPELPLALCERVQK